MPKKLFSPKKCPKKHFKKHFWQFGIYMNYDVGTSCPDSSWSVCFQVLFCLQQLQFPWEDKRLVKCSWRNLASTNKHRTERIFARTLPDKTNQKVTKVQNQITHIQPPVIQTIQKIATSLCFLSRMGFVMSGLSPVERMYVDWKWGRISKFQLQDWKKWVGFWIKSR